MALRRIKCEISPRLRAFWPRPSNVATKEPLGESVFGKKMRDLWVLCYLSLPKPLARKTASNWIRLPEDAACYGSGRARSRAPRPIDNEENRTNENYSKGIPTGTRAGFGLLYLHLCGWGHRLQSEVRRLPWRDRRWRYHDGQESQDPRSGFGRRAEAVGRRTHRGHRQGQRQNAGL